MAALSVIILSFFLSFPPFTSNCVTCYFQWVDTALVHVSCNPTSVYTAIFCVYLFLTNKQTNKHLDSFQSWSTAVTFSHDPLLSLSVMIHYCHFQSWSTAVTFRHDRLLSLSVMIHCSHFQSWSTAVTFSHDPLLSLSVMIHCCHFQAWSTAVTFSHDPLLSLSVMIHCCHFQSWSTAVTFSHDPLLSLSLSNCQTQNEQPVNCIFQCSYCI